MRIMRKKTKRSFQLWLPFTAEAVSLSEENITTFHNFSLYQAFRYVEKVSNWHFECIYFTSGRRGYRSYRSGQAFTFFPISFRWKRTSSQYRKQWSLRGLLHILFNRPDALGVFVTFGSYVSTISVICRLLRVPYIVFIQSKNIPNTRQQVKIFDHAHTVYVPSVSQKRELEQRPEFSRVNFQLLSVLPDPNFFVPNIEARDPESPRLVFIGRIIPLKGVHDVIETFNQVKMRFPNATLVLAGPVVDNDYYEQLLQKITSLGLEDSIRILGAISPLESAKILAHSDIFVFPSRSETQPFVVLESMSAGVIVVALIGTGGHDEFITHNVDGLLVDIDTLPTKVIELLCDPERLFTMQQAARKKILTHYSIEKTVSTLEVLFRKL